MGTGRRSETWTTPGRTEVSIGVLKLEPRNLSCSQLSGQKRRPKLRVLRGQTQSTGPKSEVPLGKGTESQCRQRRPTPRTPRNYLRTLRDPTTKGPLGPTIISTSDPTFPWKGDSCVYIVICQEIPSPDPGVPSGGSLERSSTHINVSTPTQDRFPLYLTYPCEGWRLTENKEQRRKTICML